MLKLDKLALFDYLGYQPHAGQLAVHQSAAPRRVLACGVRWGKSVCAAMEAVAGAMAPAESSLGWIVTPSYALTDLLFHQVRTVIEERLSHRIIQIDARERRIEIRNLLGGTSEIRGKSADNASNLLGAGLAWLIVDEAAALKDNIWSSYLSGRLVDRKGWALLVSTPRGRGWYYDLWKLGQRGGDPGFASWQAPSWNNPLLDRAVIEAERGRVPEHVFLQEFGGQFIGADGCVPCNTCGWPLPFSPAPIVLLPGMELRRCPDCTRFVDEQGKALADVRDDGEPDVAVIVVELPVKAEGPSRSGASS